MFSFGGGIDNSGYKMQSLVNASKALYLWATALAENLNEMNFLDSWFEKQKQNENASFISSRNGLSVGTSSAWPPHWGNSCDSSPEKLPTIRSIIQIVQLLGVCSSAISSSSPKLTVYKCCLPRRLAISGVCHPLWTEGHWTHSRFPVWKRRKLSAVRDFQVSKNMAQCFLAFSTLRMSHVHG